jgi:hypothetical protein
MGQWAIGAHIDVLSRVASLSLFYFFFFDSIYVPWGVLRYVGQN